jgi:hypothetical protein
MKHTKTFIILLSIAIFVLNIGNSISQTTNVYVGGTGDNGRAVILTNKTPVYLTKGIGYVNSVIVNNGKVYATGIEHNNGYDAKGKVWVDGEVLYTLASEMEVTEGCAIAVLDNDVYVAGVERDSWHIYFKGTIWKNGIAEEGYSEAHQLHSIFIDGNDVYASGVMLTPYPMYERIAAVWKNGTLLYPLTSNNIGYGCGLKVVVWNGDVYTVGYEHRIQKVWKNNVELYSFEAMIFPPYTMGFFISNGDIFVAGHEGGAAKLWKNGGNSYGGTTINLPLDLPYPYWGTYYASSVFVIGKDIYVAGGQTDGVGLLWKNENTPILLSGEDGYSISSVRSVFVQNSNNSIVEMEAEQAIYIYPNPTNGILKIGSNNLRVKNVEIFDIYGRKQNVRVEDLLSIESKINISQLSAGIYFIKIHTEAGEVVRKVLKK